MRRNTILLLGCLVAAPLAFAHSPPGTPKNFCEVLTDIHEHDYGPPGAGTVTGVGTVTNGGSLNLDGGLAYLFGLLDGNLAGDCDGNGMLADYDGHLEFATGGSVLMSETGDGVTAGSLVCFGETGHHATFGPFTIQDEIFGTALSFLVAADTVNVIPPTDPSGPNCGDFETDVVAPCVGACSVTFPSGLDGAYVVYVGDVGPSASTDEGVEGLLSELLVDGNAGGGASADSGSRGHVRSGSGCSTNCLLGSCACNGPRPNCYCELVVTPRCLCD